MDTASAATALENKSAWQGEKFYCDPPGHTLTLGVEGKVSGRLPAGKEKGSPMAEPGQQQLFAQGFASERKRGARKNWQSPGGADSAPKHPPLPDSPWLSQTHGKRLRATFHHFRLPAARVLCRDLH